MWNGIRPPWEKIKNDRREAEKERGGSLLGYVGQPLAAAFAKGLRVIGFDRPR